MSPVLAALIILGLLPEFLLGDTSSADVYVELVKTAGIAISAFASVAAVYLARGGRRTAERVEHKVNQRRHEVRHEDDPEGETRIVIEEGNGSDGNNG
jgi:hypothetical protein